MKIPLDKQAHFATGFAISAGLMVMGVPPVFAFAASSVAGAAKEIIDPFRGGHRDPIDFVATAAGAAAVLPLTLFTVWP